VSLRDAAQELRELGPWRSLYRVGWELRQRSGLATRTPDAPAHPAPDRDFLSELPFAPAPAVITALRPHLDAAARDRVLHLARESLQGRILCFGRWMGDYGAPLDWHRNPLSGARWPDDVHCAKALGIPG
jgi:hypothetical protein